MDIVCSDGSPIECHNPSVTPSKLKKFTWIRVSYPLQLSVPVAASEDERRQLIADALDKDPIVLGGKCVIDESTSTTLSELKEVETSSTTFYYLNRQRWMQPLLCFEACDVVSQFQPAESVSKSDQRDCSHFVLTLAVDICIPFDVLLCVDHSLPASSLLPLIKAGTFPISFPSRNEEAASFSPSNQQRNS